MHGWSKLWVNELPLEFFHLRAILRWQLILHNPMDLPRMHGKRLKEAAEAPGTLLGRLHRGEPN